MTTGSELRPSSSSDSPQEARLPEHGAFQLFMLALCVYSVASLAAGRSGGAIQQVILYADVGVSLVFFGDFLHQFLRAPNRSRYFWTWGWIDLVSSVPLLALGLLPGFGQLLKLGRAFRAVRIFRAMRAIRSGRRLATYILAQRAEGVILATSLLLLFLFVFASIAIFAFEDSPAANINTAENAMWWSLSTIFNVDFGGTLYPVSVEGRAIATVLAASGICLFAVITGLFTTWFQAPARKGEEADLRRLKEEIVALRIAITQKE